MTQEEKELLLKDLCARWPYGVKVRISSKPRKVIGVYNEYVVVKGKTDGETSWDNYGIEEYNIKPYLRSLSSITDEEKKELSKKYNWRIGNGIIQIRYNSQGCWDEETECPTEEYIILFDWLNAHHFDYRGLIEKGLALEAKDGMYNI